MSLSDKGWSGAIGRYRVIGPTSREDRPDILLVDTNVAIDIERFYFGTLRNQDHRTDLRALLLAFPWRDTTTATVDVEYGTAICESAWRRDGTFNAPATRRMRHALDRVLRDWGIEETRYAFAQRYPPERRDKLWRRGLPLPDPATEATYPLGALLGPYATLLYTCYLDRTRRRWRSRGRMWPMRQLIAWARDEFGALCTYEIALARDIFLAVGGRTNAARKTLKLRSAHEVKVPRRIPCLVGDLVGRFVSVDHHGDGRRCARPVVEIAESVCNADPAGRRDPDKVATILRLKYEHNWTHSRIAEHVEPLNAEQENLSGHQGMITGRE
ncbi:hypothetical protein NDR87_14330 [Nocardia sp. CDC159]|uniref:Uncharacterized protein n=1 Tax=Nocardia pulmonis TaxID=2951408 RepID=A0A9X2E4Z9_9NOCA|nr:MULTISPECIES: hypothetical protein [Nocardia]MCM6774402.1 hypothetical protein [Nocardia pulmonis]MCM6787532.1 hypothetical protein [Nocardia sp. CDC159]